MKATTIMAIVLGALIVISGVQALQLNDIKSNLDSGDVKIGSSEARITPTTNSAPATPKSLENLPQMVGGC